MIFIGDHNCIPQHTPVVVYNISSYLEGYQRLFLLPDNNITFEDEFEFDIKYANYILTNQKSYISLIHLMIDVYDNKDVYLLVTRDNGYFDYLTESIIKLIQVRYGYPVCLINDKEDYKYINIDPNFYTMSLQGLYNFDIDKEFYFRKMAESEGVPIPNDV